MLVSPDYGFFNSSSYKDLCFELYITESGYSNIPSTFTLADGTVLNADFRYEGKNATTSSWIATIGANLIITGSGPDVTTGTLTPYTITSDTAVRFNNGKSFVATSSLYGHIPTTSSYILEIIFKPTIANNCFLVSKTTASVAAGNGYIVGSSSGSLPIAYGTTVAVAFGLEQGNTTLYANRGAWSHLMIFSDASSKTFAYFRDGSISNSTSTTSSLSSSALFNIGGYNNGLARSSCDVALVQGWFLTGSNSIIAATVSSSAMVREMNLNGIYAKNSNGISIQADLASATSARYIDRVIDENSGVRKLFKVNSGYSQIKRKSGNSWFPGLLIRTNIANNIVNGEELNVATSWTTSSLTLSGNYQDPSYGTGSYGLIPTLGSAEHYISYNTNATNRKTCSIFAKAGVNSWIDLAIGSGSNFFNLSDGTKGTITAQDAMIENYGEGWYLCSVYRTGSVSSDFRIRTTNANDTISYNETTGSVVGTYIFGPTSYSTIETGNYYIYNRDSTSAYTYFGFNIDNSLIGNYNCPGGTIDCSFFATGSSLITDTKRPLYQFKDQVSDSHATLIDTNGNLLSTIHKRGVINIVDSGSISVLDGLIHDITSSWRAGSYKRTVDGVSDINENVNCDPFTRLEGVLSSNTQLYFGISSSPSVSSQFKGILRKLKVWRTRKI